MTDVFISYKREDAARVRKLVGALRSCGLDVWWDEDIPASAPWEATIEAALKSAKSVIVCWSPASVASDNVRSEARVAREDGRLIQVFLKACEAPLFFGERQGVDLSRWRGNQDDPRIAKLAETVRKVAAGERLEGGERPKRRRFDVRALAVAAALLLVIALGAGWWLLRPVSATGPQMLAVLPFRALNPDDASLVDAIWDDTRGAISRNPNLRVLGRESVVVLADKHADAASYKRKVGADYLLDGMVQHVGDQIQLKVSLVRTSDGAEVWSDRIGGKLDDVFALQTRIASEVEGRIRGRVAPGGGAAARNIATTGDVYALYAEAVAKIAQRRGAGTGEAIALLKRALAADPNYAPAWAELADATRLAGEGTNEQVNREATAYLMRALTLAPNLARAHATLGFVKGPTPEGERELRRAIALDPSDAEAWMWLGNSLLSQNKVRQAFEAHSRAVDLNPLLFSAMKNKLDDFGRLHDMKGLAAEVRRVDNSGDEHLRLLVRAHAAFVLGHPGTAARILAEFSRRYPDERHRFEMAAVLLQLGYVDQAGKIFEWPPTVVGSFKGVPEAPELLRSDFKDLRDFWQSDDEVDAPAMRYARLLSNHGRVAEYVGYYKASFRNADEFYNVVNWPGGWVRWLRIAPNAAANLRAGGEPHQADAIVQKTESIVEPLLRNGPVETTDRSLLVGVAQLRAAEGRDDDAVRYLRQAVDRGWLPDRAYYAADVLDEPCFKHLASRADFQAVRHRIFARYEEERRTLGPVDRIIS